MNIDVERMSGFAAKVGVGPTIESRRRCIVVGSSPSALGCGRGWYIDGFDGDVYRINHPARPENINDLGSRTDVLLASEWMDGNVFRSGLCNKRVMPLSDAMLMSKPFGLAEGMYLTTGMMCILMCLSVYDSVEAIGFGGDPYLGSGLYISTNLEPRRVKSGTEESPHDIRMEHDLLREMAEGQFKGRLIFLDSDPDPLMCRPDMSRIWDRFRRKVVISHTDGRFSRLPAVMQELRRVGMDKVDVQWQFASPLDKPLLESVKHIRQIEGGGYFNCTMGHYRAIATAYHLGCSEVLIMEDDIRFLKDLNMVRKTVESIPDEYDVALFDGFFRKMGEYSDWVKGRKCNDFWFEWDRMFSTSCYALSRKAMKKLLFCYEAVVTDPKVGLLRICDHYLDREILGSGMKLCAAVNNACIQIDLGRSNTVYRDIAGRYRKMGIDISRYQGSY